MPKKVKDMYFRQIITALNECDIVLQRNPRITGKDTRSGKRRWISVGGWYQDGVITIRNRPDRDNLILILIHEALHHLFPDVPEYDCHGEAVDLLSQELFCRFSTGQLKKLEYYLKP